MLKVVSVAVDCVEDRVDRRGHCQEAVVSPTDLLNPETLNDSGFVGGSEG
jgi:hypothetical protein